MKKIYGLLLIITVFGFQSCEGPEGPPGIDGRDGVNGVDGEDGEEGGLFLSTVLEAEVNFTEADDYQVGFNLEINEASNLLVFRAMAIDDEENIVWMPLPQTFITDKGVVMFNYFFTKNYFSIFLDGTVLPADLAEAFTTNQYFRVVVVPGQFPPPNARIDFNDYYAVMKWLGKDETDVEILSPQ